MPAYRVLLIATIACTLLLGHEEASAATSPCPTVCTLEYSPMCGRRANGSTKEFSNGCALRVHKCKYPGDIISSKRGRC